MKLNPINLPVANVDESRAFFERYFDFHCIETKGNNTLAILKGEDETTPVLMSNAFNKNGNATYPDAFHIGFLVKHTEQVYTIFNRLQQDGIKLEREPSNMRGVSGFYFNAPGNILVIY